MKKKNAISPTREEDFPEWYQKVIVAADLAEHSTSRGSMIIKPWGYALWENIQQILDKKIKALGHKNAYFPLMIPVSYFEKEAQHVAGFAKECAVVTHHRLKKTDDGKLIPDGELEQPLVIRPTSEMIIGEAFSRWIESHRDLPLLINQWANVVRWEMRTRLFLRSTEFLWQEGHTVHETEKEADQHALAMLDMYRDFAENILAIPVKVGQKTESEKFPGAVRTYTFEMMMQDGKALQAGTSHFLGQTFSKSCNIQFTDQEGARQYGWTTSWGVTTRLIGAIIMVHSDDDGLVLPPEVAPYHAVIIPITGKKEQQADVDTFCDKLREALFEAHPMLDLRIHIDRREMRGGEKKWHWVKKGVPLRVEVGAKECELNKISYSIRALGAQHKSECQRSEFIQTMPAFLRQAEQKMFEKGQDFIKDNTKNVQSKEELEEYISKNRGFAQGYYAEDEKVEKELQEKYAVTVRCLFPAEEGKCLFSGKTTTHKAIFARSY
jgi:prolyl-tRNA synthetase